MLLDCKDGDDADTDMDNVSDAWVGLSVDEAVVMKSDKIDVVVLLENVEVSFS